MAEAPKQYWLMKAEPDSRLEKGKDVAFSIDHFQKMGTSPWDGVRNHEAKKIMKEKMRIGDGILFYHSNCKIPGVAGLAEVSKEGHPDYTAWDSGHPYYDPKSSEDNPTWYMVEVTFKSRLPNFVSLKLLQHLASLERPPPECDYLNPDNLEAIKGMALLNRGRLSVQPVTEDAYESVKLLGEKGGFEDLLGKGAKAKNGGNPKGKVKEKKENVQEEDVETGKKQPPAPKSQKSANRSKRSRGPEGKDEVAGEDGIGVRRSKRIKSES